MKRVTYGFCSLNEGETLKVTLCDAYMHGLGLETVETVVEENGAFSIALEINENATCWVLNTVPKVALWVYAGDGDLARDDALRPLFFENYEKENGALNFSFLLDRYLRGEAIVSKKEERLICDYFAVAGDEMSDSSVICKLDEKLGEVNGL